MLGVWEGLSSDKQFKEAIYITRKSNGEWVVWGEWFDNRTGVSKGAFTSSNYRYQNGHLFFHQIYSPKPDPKWASSNDLEIWAEGKTLRIKHRFGSSALTLTGKKVQPEPSPQDRIIGSWKWCVPDWTVRFLPGGRLESSSSRDTNSGTWRQIKASPPTYEMRWDKREKNVDTVTLSPDGRRLEGKNQLGQRLWATKL
jgi:hypothetical protein